MLCVVLGFLLCFSNVSAMQECDKEVVRHIQQMKSKEEFVAYLRTISTVINSADSTVHWVIIIKAEEYNLLPEVMSILSRLLSRSYESKVVKAKREAFVHHILMGQNGTRVSGLTRERTVLFIWGEVLPSGQEYAFNLTLEAMGMGLEESGDIKRRLQSYVKKMREEMGAFGVI